MVSSSLLCIMAHILVTMAVFVSLMIQISIFMEMKLERTCKARRSAGACDSALLDAVLFRGDPGVELFAIGVCQWGLLVIAPVALVTECD